MKRAAIPSSNRLSSFLLRSVSLLIWLICLILAQPFAAVAQSNEPPLPPAAQEALNKGILAAKIPDYLLAIRYFEEARKIAPQAPVVYLNMGLAESKIPGRELRAMAWFGAYLAAYPEAPNVAAVKEQIALLEVRNQSNVSRLIKVVQDGALQIPEDDRMPTMGRDRHHILYQASKLWADIGDIARAQETAELIQPEMWKSPALTAIAEAQFIAGDIAGASQTAGRIQDKDKGGAMQKAIAEAATKTVSTSNSVIEVDDWLREMGVGTFSGGASTRPWIAGSLTTNMFLDLDGHLKSLPPPSNDIYAHYWALLETAEKIVKAQNVITRMLRQEAKK